MIGKEQVDRIVDAIEGVANEISDNSEIKLSTDDYNLIAYIGEQLERIATALEKK